MNDYISRQAALDAIDTWDKFGCDSDGKLVRHEEHLVPYVHYEDIVNAIKNLPSAQEQAENAYAHGYTDAKVDYQPKRGVWVKNGYEWAWKYHCSKCGRKSDELERYCADCGARMVNAEGSEE